MDYLLYYVEIGLITNALMFVLEFILVMFLTFSMNTFEVRKLAMIAEGDEYNLWSILHYFIPFFLVYLTIIEIILIVKYFNKTANSVEIIVKKLDNYKIFRRFK